MCVCTYVNLHACECICVCVHVFVIYEHVDTSTMPRPEQDIRCPPLLFSVFTALRQYLLLNGKSAVWTSLASQWALTICLSPSSQWRGYRHKQSMRSFFRWWVLGIWTQVLMLAEWALLLMELSPQSLFCFNLEIKNWAWHSFRTQEAEAGGLPQVWGSLGYTMSSRPA